MKLVLKKALYPSLLGFSCMLSATAQVTDENTTDDEDVYLLSPFEVTQSEDVGYLATSTLAGTRLRTSLKDVGSAVSVITKEFMEDTGAVDNKSLLVYTTNTEVGGTLGNYTGADSYSSFADEATKFVSPNQNTRVRGLTSADNTRNYFGSAIPWDGYNVSRVDLQRGPNSILFGLGSPSGIINKTLDQAEFYNSGTIKIKADENGSLRESVNYNRELVKGQVAVRVAALNESQKYKQKPAYEDDQRIYVAAKIKPAALQSDTTSTILTANYEKGNITRNAPRSLTPIDRITAWFNSSENGAYGLDKQTFDPFDVQDASGEVPNHGQAKSNYDNGNVNPYYLAALGDYGHSYGGPIVFFDGPYASEAYMLMEPEAKGTYSIGADGNPDSSKAISGIAYNRLVGIADYSIYAKNAKLPYYESGQYKDYHLTDASIFDFYNNLLDGDNKHEWQDFEAYNMTLNQTFFNNKVGYEVAYDYQNYHQGQESLLTSERQAIFIDMNATLNDGSPNPNVGRPFINNSAIYGNSSLDQKRDVVRATAFAEYDFKDMGESFWTNLLGRHIVTGLLSEDKTKSDNRQWYRNLMSDSYYDWIDNQDRTSNNLTFTQYLGDSLMDASSASGAYVSRSRSTLDLSSVGSLYTFDSHWNAPGVNPSDPFDIDGDGVIEAGETQSENPDNYVGWTTKEGIGVNSVSEDTRSQYLMSGKLTNQTVNSQALVYQGYFWDGAIVATYGWRNDKVTGWNKAADISAATNLYPLDENYTIHGIEGNKIEKETSTWSLVGHLNGLLGKYDFLPFNVSLYYNESENFQPLGTRVDVLGNPMSDPTGTTIDKSIAISTKDNKYTLKLTRYHTNVANASGTALNGAWFIGGVERWGGTWCNIFDHNLTGYTMDTQADPSSQNDGRYNYGQGEGESAADAAAREAAAIAGWRQHQENIRTQFPEFYKAWLDDDPATVKNLTGASPAGFATSEDSVSKGYELELIANPTDNWRISMNVSKTTAMRTSVGGDAFVDLMRVIDYDIRHTAAGDMRIWWGNAGAETTNSQYMKYLGGDWMLVNLLNGTEVSELRKWHCNLVTNYNFTDGFLKGVNVGMGYRWMSKKGIGYPVIYDDHGDITFDLDNPYYAPSEDYYDFWVGYKRAITDSIDWKIQININNAFSGNSLIPLSTQPDGSIAAWSIAPHRTISITNTFTF